MRDFSQLPPPPPCTCNADQVAGLLQNRSMHPSQTGLDPNSLPGNQGLWDFTSTSLSASSCISSPLCLVPVLPSQSPEMVPSFSDLKPSLSMTSLPWHPNPTSFKALSLKVTSPEASTDSSQYSAGSLCPSFRTLALHTGHTSAACVCFWPPG